MGDTNQSLLQKADLALADLTSNGGVLNPEQGDSFVRKLIKTPTLMREIRVVTMNAPERKINKIGFGSRILRKAVQGTALTSGQRSKVTTEQISLTTKELIAEVRLPYDVMEDNIERASAANNEGSNSGPGGLRDTIIQLIAERAASDLEEWIINADTAYTDADPDVQDFMSLTDGYLKRGSALGNVVDFASGHMDKKLFKKGVQAMPDQYLRNRAAMKHYVSVDQEVEYQDSLANRGTAMGDAKIATNAPAFAYGATVNAVSFMPDADGLFVDPRNLIMGFWRSISLEYDKDITTRVYIIVLTCRVGLQVEETQAMVRYKNIGAVE